MSRITKVAKSILIKWADDPQISQWNENGSEGDPLLFNENLSPSEVAKKNEQSIIREQLNRAMNSIRSDYATLKNIPGVITKIPSDILEAFFEIWNKIQSFQKDPNLDTNPVFTAFNFINFVTEAKFSGIKTPISDTPTNIEQIIFTMNKIIEENSSEFYSGKFSPKITFGEELLKISSELSQIMSK